MTQWAAAQWWQLSAKRVPCDGVTCPVPQLSARGLLYKPHLLIVPHSEPQPGWALPEGLG